MPHITSEQKELVHRTKFPVKEGDLCFLFAEAALTEFNKNPSWTSIHKIKVALTNPYHTEWSHFVILEYMKNWSKVDIEAAADLAFLEFYRLVGAKYEDNRIRENGSVFAGAIDNGFKAIALDTPTPHTIEQCEPSCYEGQGTLIVPAKRKPGRPKKIEVTTNDSTVGA